MGQLELLRRVARTRPRDTGQAIVTINPSWPERVLRQSNACIFFQAPSPAAAIEAAPRRIGPIGGWRIGRDGQQEVFARGEDREHAKPGDYTRSVIVAPEQSRQPT